MMENYAAPQIELVRFDVYDITESGASGDPAHDPGEIIGLGEVEPW